MDFGSLDFETWRLVGFGLLALGALATMIAIVAIIAMFRDGSSQVDHGRAEADDDDDRDDDDDDDDREAGRTKVAAVAGARDEDSGPTSVPVGLGNPHDNLFTVPANASPRQPIPSMRDEPHVPSPDWYEYPDVVAAQPADDPSAAFTATRQADQPATPPVSPPQIAPEQSVAPEGEESPPRTSPWFDEATDSDEASPAVAARQSETQAAPTAVSPMSFPWERRAEATTEAPERSVAPAHEEPTPTAAIEAVASATSRHSEASAAAPSPPEREESDSPAADWYDDPDGSGGERWWDGKGWTRHRRPRAGSTATADTGRQRAIARPEAAPPTTAGRRRVAATAGPGDPDDGQPPSRPPGWYRDPSGSGARRFWDGSKWTSGT